MPEENPNFPEILIRQVRKDRDVDAILGETLSILGQADVLEPFRDLLHPALAVEVPWLNNRSDRTKLLSDEPLNHVFAASMTRIFHLSNDGSTRQATRAVAV
jgi:hypothetical protein